MGPDVMILVFWMLSFKPTFSLSSFTFIKTLFSSLLFAIRVVSFAYLRLLIFLPVILIPACASSSPAFLMMYSAYKLNKQGDYTYSLTYSFLIWNQSVVPCPVLTVASWSAQRFLRRQIRWSGIPISLRIFQFVVIHTVTGFSIINEADVFFWNSLTSLWSSGCWEPDPCSSAFSKSNLYLWKFSVYILSKPAAAAKSFQLCPTLWDSIDGSPPGSPIPGVLQARVLEWVAISLSILSMTLLTCEMSAIVQ